MNNNLNDFLKELNNLNSFASKIKFANQHYNRIGSGTGRVVYEIDDNKVLKLAKNNKGIAQNREEYSISKYNDYDDILTNVIDSCDNDTWLLSEKAKKVSKKRFKDLTGFELYDVYRYLRNFKDINNGRDKIFNIDNDLKNSLDNNDFINRLSNMLIDYSLSANDMGRPSTYGEVIRNGSPLIVLTDYGLSDDVYDTYYKPKTSQNIGIYEIFDFAHGNTDYLSDIEDTSDIRRGMWALPLYGVDDNAINEEFVNFINRRDNYPNKPITSLPELLDGFYSCIGGLSTILKNNNSNFIDNLLELQDYLLTNGLLDNKIIGINENNDINTDSGGYPIVDKFGDSLENEDYARELVLNSLDKLGYPKSVNLLGGGGYGYAYELDNDYVFKITTDVSEVDAAFKIMRAEPKHIAKIYRVYKIIDSDKNLAFFGLLVENINNKPVDLFRKYRNIINNILPEIDFFRIMKKKDFNYDEAVEIAKRILTDNQELNISDKDRKDAYEFQIGLFNIRKELMDLDIKSKDYVEVKNLGYKDGVLKYFDVGGYSSKESDFGDVDKIILPEYYKLFEYADREMMDSIGKKIINKLNLSKFEYIGSGDNGVAYDIGDNKVLKLTRDKSEAMMNMKLKGKDLKHIANSYNVYSVNSKNKNNDIYVIILEKLETDPSYFKRMNDRLDKAFNLLFGMDLIEVFEHILYGHLFDDNIDINTLKNYFKKNPEDGRYFNALINISKELEKFELDSIDYLKPENLGYKKSGNIGFFDVGFGDLKHEVEPDTLEIDEDGTSKFSTDTSIGSDIVPAYNQYDSAPPIDNNLNANSSLYRENLNTDESRNKSWMPGVKSVEVKDRCKLGGLGNTSAACNQGDINNFNFAPITEEIDAKEVYNGGELEKMSSGDKDVSLISFYDNSDLKKKAIELGFGLIPIKQDSHDVDMNIVYRKNSRGINNAQRLYNIMKSKGGYVNDQSPKEAYEIGKLLDYTDESILRYINRNYVKLPNNEYRSSTDIEKKEYDNNKGRIYEYGLVYTSNDIYKDINDNKINSLINDVFKFIEKKDNNQYFTLDDIDDMFFIFKVMKHNNNKFRIFAGDNYESISNFLTSELMKWNKIKPRNSLKEEISLIKSLPFKKKIEELGGNIYSVGGAVRDEFLNKESKDLDILVTGISFEDLENILSNYGRVDAVGKSFGVLKFKPNGSNEEIDIAIPRSEEVTGDGGHKGFKITSDHNLPIEKDLKRRDFTINAIAKDGDGNIIDPFGGREDLENKIIRIVNPEAFADDPLRMLRAIQFSSRFGFEIEPNTMKMIRDNADKIKEIAPERILIEFNKIVDKGNKLIGAQQLKNSGLFKEIFGFEIKQSTINRSPFDEVETIGEFLFLLLRLLSNPADFYKNNLKGDIDTYKEIKALDIAFNISTNNPAMSRSIAHNMYIISPNSLNSKIIPQSIIDAANELIINKYPKTINDLAINGNDLIKLGLNGKEIGDTLKTLLLKIYADKINNDMNELILMVKKILNEKK